MNADKCTFPYGGAGALQQKNVRLRIQYAEKMSHRLDQLKREDPVLEYDLIEIFRSNMEKVRTNMGLQNYEPLLQLLPNGTEHFDQLIRNQFTLLINN